MSQRSSGGRKMSHRNYRSLNQGNSSSYGSSFSSFLQNRIFQFPFIIFITTVIVFALITWHQKNQQESSTTVDNRRSFQRLNLYCAKEQTIGSEIRENIKDWKLYQQQFQLKKLVITIRHGDRSSIHMLPNSQIDLSQHHHHGLLAPEALGYTPHLSNFTLRIVGEKQAQGEIDLSQGLDPSFLSHGSDFTIAPGQLTSRGFMQHIHLGKLVRSAYNEFFEKLTPNDIYVRSTNYLRTIRSVGAFLISAFPQFLAASNKLKILIHKTEAEEVMHGIGLRSSSHNQKADQHGENEVVGQCEPAVSHARKQKQQFNFSAPIANQILALFGPDVQKLLPTDITDASMPAFCHRLPLPCSTLERSPSLRPSNCLDEALLNKLMVESDRYYCNRFSGKLGGKDSTNLSIYPFISEILKHISPHYNAHKVSIFSGHDTVIAPVLSGLGVYKGRLCRWPQYASRIIFELWERTNLPFPEKITSEKMIQAATAFITKQTQLRATMFMFSEIELKELFHEKYFIRVIFNGEDVTSMIPACEAERLSLAKYITEQKIETDSSWVYLLFMKTNFPFCSISSLTKQIKQMIAPHKSISEACGAGLTFAIQS